MTTIIAEKSLIVNYFFARTGSDERARKFWKNCAMLSGTFPQKSGPRTSAGVKIGVVLENFGRTFGL